MRKEVFKVLLKEAEDKYGKTEKGYKAVGEKLFNATYDPKTNRLDTSGLSFKAMTEAVFEYNGHKDVSIHNFFEDVEGMDVTESQRVKEAVTTGAIPTIIGTVLEKSFIEAYNYHSAPYMSLVKELDWKGTDTTKATIPGMQAVSDFKARPEGTPYFESGLKEKYAEIAMKDFGRIINVTWEAVVSDQTGLLLERAQSLGEAGAAHRNKMIVQTIEMVAARSTMGETATAGCVLNGSTLTQANVYNTTHAAVTGTDLQVNANLLSTNKALDYDGLKEAFGLARIMKDEKGEFINVNPTTLLVYSTSFVDAWNLMNTQIGQPGSSDANANFFLRRFSIVDTPYLSDTNSWYLGEFPKQVVWMWVDRPKALTETESAHAFFTSKVLRSWRFSYHGGGGMRDYRYIIRSAGES